MTVQTFEEDEAIDLLREACRALGCPLRFWTVLSGVYDGLAGRPEPVPDSQHPAAALHHLNFQDAELLSVGGAADGAAGVACLIDLGEHLSDARTRRGLRDLISTMRRSGGTVVLIDHGSPDAADGGGLPAVVRAHARPFELSLPTEDEIEGIVRSAVRRLHATTPIQVELTRAELGSIVRNLRGLRRREIERVMIDVAADDRRLDASDLPRVIGQKREIVQSGGMLEYVDAPASLSDIGGMENLKRWLRSREHALDAGRSRIEPPRGVLLLGVQGAGKSLCAKAIAAAWRRPLLRMDVGALYDKYIGQSEKRLRETLDQAELMSPIILWIDEIEKAFASAAGASNDGGLSRRMFGALLTWMQEHRAPVFLVATANDIEALPPELLRKGRFDEIFFVDLPGAAARAQILSIHLRRRGEDPASFDAKKLVAASSGFSGAEIEQAVLSSMHEVHEQGEPLTTAKLVSVMKSSPPLSVTMAERIEELRAWARGRCVMAD
ncbi:MAG: AAA family ATPase [Planctomycetota bacterium]